MDLLTLLNKNENARKIFGKREIKIIEKQLNGISLTQSEKNRLSRDIRKKLEFIQEIIQCEDEFELKKGALIKQYIEEAVQEIHKHQLKDKIKEIWLFGSAASNQLTFRSDIDIAVLFDEVSIEEATRFRARISGIVSDRVDIQVFNILPEKIKETVIKNHKVLYKKNGSR